MIWRRLWFSRQEGVGRRCDRIETDHDRDPRVCSSAFLAKNARRDRSWQVADPRLPRELASLDREFGSRIGTLITGPTWAVAARSSSVEYHPAGFFRKRDIVFILTRSVQLWPYRQPVRVRNLRTQPDMVVLGKGWATASPLPRLSAALTCSPRWVTAKALIPGARNPLCCAPCLHS